MEGGSNRIIPNVDDEFNPYKEKFDKKYSGIFEKPKEKPKSQNSIYEKISNPYRNYSAVNTSAPMPGSYSINFNMPNMNPYIPPQAQTPIPMTAIPMPFGNYPLYAPYQPDIIKKYNVNISTGDLGSINHIYQDLLPKNSTNLDRYTTISERLNIANYYGTFFAKLYATNDIPDMSGSGTNNMFGGGTISKYNLSEILGHFKLSTLNPYYTIFKQDVKSLINLPTNFFMYSCCNPIKYNSDNNSITCNDDSIRSHIRIYRFIKGNKDKIQNEFEYYNKINELLKSKKCPNFVMKYDFIYTVCKIDFDTINNITTSISHDKNKIQKIQEIKKIIKENSNSNSKTHDCYLMLTEGVNYNIIDFCDPKYIEDKKSKSILTQVNTGIILDHIWESIIFQILVTLYVLQQENIYFSEISLINNIFIKRIDITPENIKYWKYVINNVTYYVPNYGYLVMFDSNYNSDIIFNKKDNNEYLKIFDSSISENISKNIKKIFDSIKSESNDINKVIFDIFYKYTCDKLGHFISDTSELQLMHHDKNFKYGDLVLYNKYSNTYIISCYKEKDKIMTNTVNIQDYNDKDIKFMEIPVSQDLIIKFKENITKEVIETYII